MFKVNNKDTRTTAKFEFKSIMVDVTPKDFSL